MGDRVAIVTGAATGIGAAIARRLAGGGWRLALGYRSSEAEAKAEQADETCQASLRHPQSTAGPLYPVLWVAYSGQRTTPWS